jgi:hypothetical protein
MPNYEIAPSNRSIWNIIDQETFTKHVEELTGIKRVVTSSNSEIGSPRDELELPLPLEVEKQLADYFAFIASTQRGITDVAAATVEIPVKGPSLRVLLAGSEGIKDGVKDTFVEIFGLLEDCAQKSGFAFHVFIASKC